MKRVLLFIAFVFISSSTFATDYYTCTNPSGTNATLASNGADPCTETINTWNQVGNTLYVTAGSTFFFPDGETVIGTIIVEEGATMNILAGGTADLNITGTLIISGTVSCAAFGSANFILSAGGYLEVTPTGLITNGGIAGGQVTISGGSNATINGAVVATGNVTVIGTVIGSGTIDVFGGGTINGSGTINGTTQPWPSSYDLGNNGTYTSTWSAGAWTPGTPGGLNATAIIDDDFDENTDGEFKAIDITINSGITARLTTLRSDVSAITNNGTLELEDSASVGAATVISGSGDITMIRNFNRTGWHHIGWPVNGTQTLDDLNLVGVGAGPVGTPWTFDYSDPTATPLYTNIFYWDPNIDGLGTDVGWQVPNGSTPIAGRAFNIYVLDASNRIELKVANADLNNGLLSQAYDYADPGTNPPANTDTDKLNNGWADDAETDGWNMLINPYQQNINVADLTLPAGFANDVYAWDGVTYKTGVGGTGDLVTIGINQAFYVRNTTNSSGTYAVPSAARTNAYTGGYFKTRNVFKFNLKGDGYDLNTYVSEDAGATNKMDDSFDAYFFPHTGDAPYFNSVGKDSTAYSVNCLPELDLEEMYLTFNYKNHGEVFTLSLDNSQSFGIESVLLHDLHTNTTVDLMSKPYQFTSDIQANAQRFKLSFHEDFVNIEEYSSHAALKAWFANNELIFGDREDLEGSYVEVYNLSGQKIASGNIEDPIFVDKEGIYVISVLTKGGTSLSAKVFKNVSF